MSFGFLVISFAVVASLAWLIEKRMTRRTIREFLKQERQDKGQLGKHRLVLDDAGHGRPATDLEPALRLSTRSIL